MANREMCDECGEQYQYKYGLCKQCLDLGMTSPELDPGAFIPDNPGYRYCNCEDYPCCGH